MKKEKVKVGMVVFDREQGAFVKVASRPDGSRTRVEQFGNYWFAENRDLRPLTAREKGESQ